MTAPLDIATARALVEAGVDALCTTCEGNGNVYLGKSDEDDDGWVRCEACEGTATATLTIASLVPALLDRCEELERLLGYSREGVAHWTKEAERWQQERDAEQLATRCMEFERDVARKQRDNAITERDAALARLTADGEMMERLKDERDEAMDDLGACLDGIALCSGACSRSPKVVTLLEEHMAAADAAAALTAKVTP
jgi:PAS domain-containing protein